MKKALALCLTLSLALTLAACAPKPREAVEAIAPAPVQEAAAEVWDFDLSVETASEERKNEDGVLLATWSCEQPVLRLVNEAGEAFSGETPERGVTAEQLAACRTFNAETAAYAKVSHAELDRLEADARELYGELEEEYRANFMPFAGEDRVENVFRRGDLLDVLSSSYGYWGGVHGGLFYGNLHFDLKTGEFFALSDLTDRPDELRGILADEVVAQIYRDDNGEGYFWDCEQTVRATEEYNVSLGETELTVYFGEYELAPYAMGILEFPIPYARIARVLNERGERLLALSAEDRALGDYYDAEKLWSWIEGAIPMDYDTSRTARVEENGESWEMYYSRVDVPGVTTLDALRERLRTRFSDALVERMLAPNEGGAATFREFDGELYAAPVGRGDDLTVESVDYRVELEADGSGGKVIVTIHRQDYDDEKEEWVPTGTDTVEFPFEQTDGGARFTAFESVW